MIPLNYCDHSKKIMKNKNLIALLLVTAFVSSLVTYLFCKQDLIIDTNAGIYNTNPTEVVPSTLCSYKIERLNGFKYIRPIVYAEPECEGPKYLPLKEQIHNQIEDYKNAKSLISASVYLRGFNNEIG